MSESEKSNFEDSKLVTPVEWTGEEMEIDDARFLRHPLTKRLPEWVVNAAENGMLQTGHIGYFERRQSGRVVFKESIP